MFVLIAGIEKITRIKEKCKKIKIMVEKINNIQLRAARHAVNLRAKDIANIIGVATRTVGNYETKTLGEEPTERFFKQHSKQLIQFFKEEHNIIYPDYYSIELQVPSEVLKQLPKEGGALTRFQLRCARFVLNISQATLSKYTGISETLLRQQECKSNEELLYMYQSNSEVEQLLQKWFFYHGIEFENKYYVKVKKLLAISPANLLRSEPVNFIKTKKEVMPT